MEILNEYTLTHTVSHIFNYAFKKTSPTTHVIKRSSCVYNLNSSNTSNIKQLLKRNGEPGYGFSISFDYLKKFKFYDKAITGTGDLLNMIGFNKCESIYELIKNDRYFQV